MDTHSASVLSPGPMRKVVVATHGNCFDGLCSAALYTALLRHVHKDTASDLSFSYRGWGYGPGQNGVDPATLTGDENAILDYRYSQAGALTWYFDHHVSAFSSPEDRASYETKAAVADGARRFFHDGAYPSCTKLIADVGRERFGFDTTKLDALITWADMIDSARFPSAEMVVARKEPVLHLMTVVEHAADDAFITKMVPRLLETPIEDLAREGDVQAAYAPLAAQNDAYVELVKKHATEVGRGAATVILVDLSSVIVDVATKFVTYALWPKSAYSVVISRSKSKLKLSIGYNPWSGTERTHDIAKICERHGGGGHPVVGAISLPLAEEAKAKTLAAQISEELAG